MFMFVSGSWSDGPDKVLHIVHYKLETNFLLLRVARDALTKQGKIWFVPAAI